jgi:limonene-1,2-epoxide hydrolase
MSDAIDVATKFWDALYTRDWERIRASFTEDAIYYDVPVGAAAAAKGPKDIEARLRVGIEPLSDFWQHDVTIVATGDVVMTEHIEVWDFPTGERAELPFVSVQQLQDGLISMWKDYWHQPTLMDAAPAWWHERLATADLSWVYDATGEA